MPDDGDTEVIGYRLLRPRVSEHYKGRFDLRPLGLNATLHYSCRFNGSHKLEILKTATQSVRQMQELICGVFDCNPTMLRLARIDLAADVVGIPIRWFLTRMIERAHVETTERIVRAFGARPG